MKDMGSKTVNVFWYMSNNFGDNLNYYLVKRLSEKEPVYCDDRANQKHYIVCGSILTECNDNSTLWGPGMANYGESISSKPEVCMVRGELTRQQLGVECAVGDPCLLMPRLYWPVVNKRHKCGVIPHWKDVEQVAATTDAYLINPLKPALEVIHDILSCETIMSSSLHGLILSDAYGIPNYWMDTGMAIGGDGFKFDDYYSTTDKPKKRNGDGFFVSKFKYDLDDMLKACPFRA
jgi:pyruvyltransferase